MPLFFGSLTPSTICQNLAAYFSIPIIPGKTLVFFDEIQACPQALSALRFFYEQMPNLHVIACGSLLELVLSDIPSLGVGRISSLFMYPMSFDEFLLALGENTLIEMKTQASFRNPLGDVFHKKLIDYLKIFYLIGGMPEAVNSFITSGDILLCQKLLNDLIESLQDDFSKYKKNAPTQRLREVFDSIAFQCGQKFKYSKIDSHSAHQSLKDALEMLVQAGIAHKAYHTSAQGIPLGAQIKLNKFKIIPYDPGIYQKMLGLTMHDHNISRGIRLSLENFTHYENIDVYPLYAIKNIFSSQ